MLSDHNPQDSNSLNIVLKIKTKGRIKELWYFLSLSIDNTNAILFRTSLIFFIDWLTQNVNMIVYSETKFFNGVFSKVIIMGGKYGGITSMCK